MKWIFILLLVGNVVYLGWEIDRDSRIYHSSVSKAIKIPAGTHRLKMLSELESLPEKRSQLKSAEEVAASSFNSEPVLPIELNPNTEQMIDTLLSDSSVIKMDEGMNTILENDEKTSEEESLFPKQEKTVCYTYGPIPDDKESALLSNWLNDRNIQYAQRKTDEQGRQMFWVYLAPQESLAQAEATVKDLKQKGVSDLHLIRSGDLLNAISLGLFSSQAAVNRRLNELKAKGYQSVVVPYSGGKKVHWFDVSIVQNSSYVNELFTGFPARFKAVPVNCDEIAMQLGNP